MPLNFNSHAHVERDQSRPKRQSHRLYFNSHAHVERDAYVLEKDKFDNISTHTLTWSVTECLQNIDTGEEISTHTLTWSVTNI